jgi:hypothetical protein
MGRAAGLLTPTERPLRPELRQPLAVGLARLRCDTIAGSPAAALDPLVPRGISCYASTDKGECGGKNMDKRLVFVVDGNCGEYEIVTERIDDRPIVSCTCADARNVLWLIPRATEPV